MSMLNFFKKDAVHKLEQEQINNGLGGVQTIDRLGDFVCDGLLVDRSRSNKTVGAFANANDRYYNLFVPSDVALAKNDKICYNRLDGIVVYIELTTDAILNDEASGQTAWKTYEAATYSPVLEGEDGRV